MPDATPPDGYNPATPLFRLVARHTDDDHKDSAPASLGPVFDDLQDVQEALDSVTKRHRDDVDRRNVSLPVDERVRVTLADRLAELEVLGGYDVQVEQLFETAWDHDDADPPNLVPVAHEWRPVNQPEEA